MAEGKKLTAKQERFVQEYLIDLNATQAAIRAGYSEKTAQEQSSRLLSNVMVAEEIQAGRDKLAEKAEITAERVLREYAKLGFSDIRKVLTPEGHLIDPQDWDDDTAAAIASIEVVTTFRADADKSAEERRKVDHTHKIKVWDKRGALDSMAKHLGMFVDRHEHSGPGGKPIEIEDMSKGERARRIAFSVRDAEREARDGASSGGDSPSQVGSESGTTD